jgi:BlaI family transcriptional regulator, penicillinase repressor
MKRVTDFELKVLGVVWQRGGGATVQEILDSWPEPDVPGYTTILKTLQKLEAKHVVTHRKGEGRAYTYLPAVSRDEVSAGRVRELVDSLFGGDRLAFMHSFIDEEIDAEELRRLRSLIEEREREERL